MWSTDDIFLIYYVVDHNGRYTGPFHRSICGKYWEIVIGKAPSKWITSNKSEAAGITVSFIEDALIKINYLSLYKNNNILRANKMHLILVSGIKENYW